MFTVDLKHLLYPCINADGQNIAKKLPIQITRETEKLHVLVQEYNACVEVCKDVHLQQVDIQEAKYPSASVKGDLDNSITSWDFAAKKLDIINAHLMLTRAREEMLMLKEEMLNTVLP